MDELDDAGTYFDFDAKKVTSSGVFHYMSTRNNNFSNRDQKGVVVSYENEFFDDFIGSNGGVIDFRVGKMTIPEGTIDQLEHFRVDIKNLENVNQTELHTKVLLPNNFDQSTMASDLIIIKKPKSQLQKSLKINLRLKRALEIMESHNLYRINNELLTKVESKIKDENLEFETNQSGIYVVKYERSYGILIAVLVSIGVLILIILAISFLLYKNPNLIKSLRYRANNLKRSMNNQL